jgi:ABC-type transporter Mla subunit MlaD
LTASTDWPHLIFSVGAGLGVLLIGIGILVVCSAIAGTLKRLNTTLDEVDRQVAALSAPVAATLGHVGGIADTADATIARLSAVVGSLETVASGVVKTSGLANEAVSPAIVNVGVTLTGLTAGVRSFVNGKSRRDADAAERLLHERDGVHS